MLNNRAFTSKTTRQKKKLKQSNKTFKKKTVTTLRLPSANQNNAPFRKKTNASPPTRLLQQLFPRRLPPFRTLYNPPQPPEISGRNNLDGRLRRGATNIQGFWYGGSVAVGQR
ncbi:hypothetical protein HanRHA438_Chr01g0002611 [Helianthus annuus]|nr:hypothetical protein HanRHA438_Chr01g0002611 [Helianthus annuus]